MIFERLKLEFWEAKCNKIKVLVLWEMVKLKIWTFLTEWSLQKCPSSILNFGKNQILNFLRAENWKNHEFDFYKLDKFYEFESFEKQNSPK